MRRSICPSLRETRSLKVRSSDMPCSIRPRALLYGVDAPVHRVKAPAYLVKALIHRLEALVHRVKALVDVFVLVVEALVDVFVLRVETLVDVFVLRVEALVHVGSEVVDAPVDGVKALVERVDDAKFDADRRAGQRRDRGP